MRPAVCALAAIVAAASLVVAGCGGDSAADAKRLDPEERALVGRTQRAIRDYCREVALFTLRKGEQPTSVETQALYDAVDRTFALAREKPEAPMQRGATLRDVLGDTVEDVEGANCSGSLEHRLEAGFASLPPSTE